MSPKGNENGNELANGEYSERHYIVGRWLHHFSYMVLACTSTASVHVRMYNSDKKEMREKRGLKKYEGKIEAKKEEEEEMMKEGGKETFLKRNLCQIV